jgi:hypothetical protein
MANSPLVRPNRMSFNHSSIYCVTGGPDASKYTGTLDYVGITSVSPSRYYWGIDQSIQYGSTPILRKTAGIVDTV